VLGAERQVMMTEEDRRRTAYHEGGHAIVGMLTEGADPVRKISIIPRGVALGVTFSAPDADRYNYERRELLAKIKVRGRRAGRRGDRLRRALDGGRVRHPAADPGRRQMVGRWGMSDAIGLLAVIPRTDKDRPGPAPARSRHTRSS